MANPSRKIFIQRKIDGEVFRYVFHTDTVWRLIEGKRWVNMSSKNPGVGEIPNSEMGIHFSADEYYLVLTGGGFYRTFVLSPSQQASYEHHREYGWPNKDRPYMDEKGVIPPNTDKEFGRFD